MKTTLRVATLNVRRLTGRERGRVAALGERLASVDLSPHVVALQEVSEDAADELARRAGFPHCSFVRHARFAARGVALLHHAPALERDGARVPVRWGNDKGWARVVLAHEGRPVELVGLHLDWVSRRARGRQIEALARALPPAASTRVVLGDLNAMGPRALLDGEVHDDTAAALAEALGVRASPARLTFPSRRPRWALDWVLASEPARFADVRVVPVQHSDHAALVADLALGDT